MTNDSSKSPIQFPCEFPIKAFGSGHGDFEILVVSIVRHHAPNLAEGAVTSRPSKNGKYLAVTVTIQAQSQGQLDAIYRDLTACSEVAMAL
jgi:putative lipoic acid-binding regulatory protein